MAWILKRLLDFDAFICRLISVTFLRLTPGGLLQPIHIAAPDAFALLGFGIQKLLRIFLKGLATVLGAKVVCLPFDGG